MEINDIMIRRGIFQGDTLSPLLFILAINPVSYLLDKSGYGYKIENITYSHILYMDDLKTFAASMKEARQMAKIVYDFTQSIGMKFGLDKCKVLNIERGKIKSGGHIKLNENDAIEEMDSSDVYKYLGVIESSSIKHTEMKKITLDKFKKKIKNILKSELNAKNIMTAINEYAIPVLSYTFGIVNWTEHDIKNADILVRKTLNMNRMFEVKSDVDRLYVPRKMGGRGLISIWDCFKCTNLRLAHFLNNTNNIKLDKCRELDYTGLFSICKRAEKFQDTVTLELPEKLNEKPILRQAQIVAEKAKIAFQKDRYETLCQKPQHGIFFKTLDGASVSKKWSLAWLDKAHMTPQSESFILAAQELALFTRWHEKHILFKQVSDLCRVCQCKTESMSHILSGCDTLAKKEYLDRHNGVATYIHHAICQNYNIQTCAKWHAHKPSEIIMLKNVEITYDAVISTDRPYVFNRPDIVVRDKLTKKCYIIDVSCPNDINVSQKEQEKITKYAGLRTELGRMWDCECVVVPVVIGGLGVVSENFEKYKLMVPANLSTIMCTKITLLGSEKILRGFLARK